MAFTNTQIRALRRRVPRQRTKLRHADGKEITYIEGWYAIDQANRIFGFDGWDRETVNAHCVNARSDRTGATAIYTARVRVTVRTAGGTIVRDGHGTGDATAPSLADAHDRALKAAETDATKRALATFGKAFGLALYAGASGDRVGALKSGPTGTTPAAKDGGKPPAGTAVNGPHSDDKSGSELAKPSTNGWNGFKLSAVANRTIAPIVQRQRDKAHLRYVASQPCLLCGARPCDAHHLGFAQPRALGRKVSDEFTVPLCRSHHRELHHEGNEIAWWHDMGIDPLPVARDLWSESQSRNESSQS